MQTPSRTTAPGSALPGAPGSFAPPPAALPLSGLATREGTERLAARFAGRLSEDFRVPLPHGPSVARVGLGTFLGGPDDADDSRYEEATLAALEGGANLLDTAISYRCQRSERAVGRALRQAVSAGAAARDEVVVCTKGGYVPLDGTPPSSREAYREYVTREYVETGLICDDELVAGGHCLAPAFLSDQLARSRANLGVRAIDIYYVHNPEQQLDAVKPAVLRERLRLAFAMLEERARAGDIGAYGCASWQALQVPPEGRGHLALADFVELAREAGGDGHHFKAVQVPVSLAASDAVRTRTQPIVLRARTARGRDRTVVVSLVEAAAELGVAVVAAAPLMQGRLTQRLPMAVADAFPRLTTDAQRALASVLAMPGIAAAVVGMRSPAHVAENLAVGREHRTENTGRTRADVRRRASDDTK